MLHKAQKVDERPKHTHWCPQLKKYFQYDFFLMVSTLFVQQMPQFESYVLMLPHYFVCKFISQVNPQLPIQYKF
jgi:hypothetical protein